MVVVSGIDSPSMGNSRLGFSVSCLASGERGGVAIPLQVHLCMARLVVHPRQKRDPLPSTVHPIAATAVSASVAGPTHLPLLQLSQRTQKMPSRSDLISSYTSNHSQCCRRVLPEWICFIVGNDTADPMSTVRSHIARKPHTWARPHRLG